MIKVLASVRAKTSERLLSRFAVPQACQGTLEHGCPLHLMPALSTQHVYLIAHSICRASTRQNAAHRRRQCLNKHRRQQPRRQRPRGAGSGQPDAEHVEHRDSLVHRNLAVFPGARSKPGGESSFRKALGPCEGAAPAAGAESKERVQVCTITLKDSLHSVVACLAQL